MDVSISRLNKGLRRPGVPWGTGISEILPVRNNYPGLNQGDSGFSSQVCRMIRFEVERAGGVRVQEQLPAATK